MRLLYPFLFLLLMYACKPVEPVTLTTLDGLPRLTEAEDYEKPCSYNENNAPDEYTDQKIIKVNVHFIDNPEQNHTWALEEGKKYMKKVINDANKRLGNNAKMNLPVGNETAVLDPGFRYKVIGVEPGDDGYYYHIDSTDYYFINKGRKKNNYSKAVIEKHGISTDTILNIFVISHPQDSLDSKNYKTFGTGIALGTSLKITGLYSNRDKPAWSWATLLNHEIGHVLGLAHAWTKYDGCDDTPIHPNCWDAKSKRGSTGKPCGESYSNNVMDYNNSQMAYSPCQLGKIHKGFNTPGFKVRKLLYDRWCDYVPDDPIVIRSAVEWKGSRDLNRDIIIENGGRLDLHCRLAMAAGSTLTIKKGAQLHMHTGSRIENSCEEAWKGIVIEDPKNMAEMIKVYGINAKIQDVNVPRERKVIDLNKL